MPMLKHRPGGARRLAALAALGAASALLAAACGSSAGSSGGSSPGSGASQGAKTTSSVSAAQQVVAQALKRPTSITVGTPVGNSIPTGKKLVFISCGAPECELQGKIVAQAAALLGWKSSTIATDGSPTSIQGAYETAMRQGVSAIVTTAALRAEIEAQIPQLEAKHIVVSDASSTDPIAAPFIYNTSTTAQNGAIGKYLAAEIVANSQGKANTVYVNLPQYSILGTLGQSFKQYYQQWCRGCGYATVDVSLTQIANAPNIIVSYLRSHPSVNYVALSVADALDNGLPAALSAAGLSHVEIVGQGGGPTDFQYLANGQELALVPFDYYSVDYMMIDALARHFAGTPVQLTAPPLWLMTKSNLPASHTQLFPDIVDFQGQFEKLWGK